MRMIVIGVLAALLCLPLAAQEPRDAGYEVSAHAGVGTFMSAPYTQIRVTITKRAPEPFVGRLVFIDDAFMMYGPGTAESNVRMVVPVAIDEGQRRRDVRFEVPIQDNHISGRVLLEAERADGVHVTLAESNVMFDRYTDSSEVSLAFVGDARLATVSPYLFASIHHVPVQDVPESWRSLYSFPMVMVNDDGLSRAQIAALRDYLVSGGTLILSPRGPNSFNPESLIGTLTGVPSVQRPIQRPLSDFAVLLEPVPEFHEEPLLQPVPDATVTLWPEAGSMGAVPGGTSHGLFSTRAVGAGTLVLLHVSVHDAPFAMDDLPTTATVNLMALLLEHTLDASRRLPQSMLAETGVKRELDIAGRRVPGPEVVVIVLMLYVSVAGVGMFLLARKIKRPELYPGVLILCAVVSVALVLTLGELIKRGSDRVTSVRLVVSDDETDRQMHATLACAYAVRDGVKTFEYENDMLVLPVGFDSQRTVRRGVPSDILEYQGHIGATSTRVEVQDVVQWQNVFHSTVSTETGTDFKARIEALSGAWRVTNEGPHELRSCFIVVPTPEAAGYLWFFLPRLAGGEIVTLARADNIERIDTSVVAVMRESLNTHEFNALTRILRIPTEETVRIEVNASVSNYSGTLFAGGLLRDANSAVMLGVVRDAAGLGRTPEISDVTDSQRREVVIWAARTTLRR